MRKSAEKKNTEDMLRTAISHQNAYGQKGKTLRNAGADIPHQLYGSEE